jgi:cytochrome c oxidase subunit 4
MSREHARDGRSPASPEPGRSIKEPTVLVLVLTLVALLLLAALSLVLSRLNLGGYSYPVALGIAVVKAALVAVFFMELLHEATATHLVLGAGITLLGLLIALLVADVVTRTVPPLEPPPGNAQRFHG